MEDYDNMDTREDVFSRAVKAGKRTYFFDVKCTRDSELYITVTESKKRFDNALAKFVYDKHKIFLYQEDFEKFMHGLQDAFTFIDTGKEPPERVYKEVKRLSDISTSSNTDSSS
jgi:hypothetical protein